MRGPVQNQFPSLEPSVARIAIIGESPGEQEVKQGKPFVGHAGLQLDKLLGHAGISRAQCFVGNICQFRPSATSNDFDLLDWNGPEVQGGIEQLRKDLEQFRPTIVLCLGNAALHLFKAGNVMPPRSRRKSTAKSDTGRNEELITALLTADSAVAPTDVHTAGGQLAPGAPAVRQGLERDLASGSNSSVITPELLRSSTTTARDLVEATPPAVTQRELADDVGMGMVVASAVDLADDSVAFPPSSAGGTEGEAASVVTSCVASPVPSAAIVDFERQGPAQAGAAGLITSDALRASENLAITGSPSKQTGPYNWPHKIGDWRGSLFTSRLLTTREVGVAGVQFESVDDGPALKCMATYHPAALLRDGSLQQYIKMDLARLRVEAQTADLHLPKRTVVICWPDDWSAAVLPVIQQMLTAYRTAGCPIAIDTEGSIDYISCIGFSNDPAVAHVIPFTNTDGTSCWSEEDEILIWQAVEELLNDTSVTKVFVNYLHDAFTLAWTMGVLIRGPVIDTMVESWELNCELEKGLAVQASWLTREPHWKTAENYRDRLLWVCGVDCCVTLECHQRLEELLRQ